MMVHIHSLMVSDIGEEHACILVVSEDAGVRLAGQPIYCRLNVFRRNRKLKAQRAHCSSNGLKCCVLAAATARSLLESMQGCDITWPTVTSLNDGMRLMSASSQCALLHQTVEKCQRCSIQYARS